MSLSSRKVIVLLLIAALAIFAYVRKEIFFQQAKRLIEQSLEKSFPCQVSIAKIRPSLLYGIVLEDLEIGFAQGRFGSAVNIKVDKAHANYNLKNISQLQDFIFVLEGGHISFGQAKKYPILKNLQGRLKVEPQGLYFQDVSATFKDNPQNVLKLYGELSQASLNLTANLEHLKLGNFDLLTNLSLSVNKKLDLEDKSEKLCATLKSYGSVLNNRPFPELNSSFEIKDEKLRILTFSLEDNYDLRGIVDLTPPFNVDLSLNFYQAAPHELISQISSSEELGFSGLLNGLIKLTGSFSQPKVEGYLEAKEGQIGDLDFVSADINLKGRYPKISIVDSRILREEDSFIMEGEIDLSNLEEQNFMDIKIKADKAILWQGWDITRKQNNQLHMSKSIADDLKVTFDMDEEAGASADNDTNELGLEYKIFGDKLLKLRLKKDEGILGVERRIKF